MSARPIQVSSKRLWCVACGDVADAHLQRVHPVWHTEQRWLVTLDAVVWCPWCELYELASFGCADEGAEVVPPLSGESMSTLLALNGGPSFLIARRKLDESPGLVPSADWPKS